MTLDTAEFVADEIDEVTRAELLDLLLEFNDTELALELINATELLELDTLELTDLRLELLELTAIELTDFELELIAAELGALLDVVMTVEVAAELVIPFELATELLEFVLAVALLRLPAELLEPLAEEGISLPAADWLVCDVVLCALLLVTATAEDAVDVGVSEALLPFPPPPPPQAESVKLRISAPP